MKTICKHAYPSDLCGTCNPIAKEPRNARRSAVPCSDFLREQVRLLQKAGWIAHAKEFEAAISALRVIHTWATFDGGRCLNPQDVAKLTRKALKGFISSSPNAQDQTREPKTKI